MGVAAVIYAARSKTGEDLNESTASQVEQIRTRLADRVVVGEPHIDYASGSKSDRGPGLAAAIAEATAAAERDGSAELWVYHSSRLGRGSGKPGKARAIGRLLYELLAVGVTVRSVTDDEFTTNEMLWGFASRQAAKYSEDLSIHVTRGYVEAAKRGTAAWLARGIRLGGYEVLKDFDPNGRVVHTARKHPEDAWIYELIWEMALAGRSALTIQLELSNRGARTRPARKDHQARPFDVNRISQILDNPAYAGLLVHNGEVVGPGSWPAYVSPEDFWRLRGERQVRTPKRPRGRPAGTVTAGSTIDPETGKRVYAMAEPMPYLLAQLATCGECGASMRAKTQRGTRRYVCSAHVEHHRNSEERCSALPIDAEAADKLVVERLDQLLADADAFRAQLAAGEANRIERLRRIATDGQAEADKADRVVERAMARYTAALAEDDEETADINLAAVRRARQEAEAARSRSNAALDALRASPAPEPSDVLQRVWAALSGQLGEAGNDVRRMNAALRETFERFQVSVGQYTGLRIVPVISADVLAGMTSTPAAFQVGKVSAYVLDDDGCVDEFYGAHLTGATKTSSARSRPGA